MWRRSSQIRYGATSNVSLATVPRPTIFSRDALEDRTGLPGFEGRSSVKTWAFTIATRVATDHFRRPQNRALMVAVEETTHIDYTETEQRLVVDEMSSCVREVIDSLPEDYRTALVLHDLEGQTAAQVAEIVGCSIANAKIRIHRGRRRLKEALNEECTFYRDEENVFRCDRKQDG